MPSLVKASLVLLLGIAIGLSLCVNSIYILVLLFFLPLIWLGLPNRTLATLFSVGFYGAAAWEVLPDIPNYYGLSDQHICGAIGVWSAATLIPALPWFICYAKHKQRLLAVVLSLMSLLVLLTLPPFGILIWGNPFTSAGLFYPSFGLWGLGLCFLLLLTLAVSLYVPKYRRSSLALFVVLALIAGYANFKPKPARVPQWIALNTNPYFTKFDSYLTTLVREQLDAGNKVIILPENILHLDSYHNSPLWQKLLQELAVKQASLVTGAQSDGVGHKDHQEGILIIDPQETHFYPSRQPLPIISWNPFSRETLKAYWLQTGVYSIQGQRTVIFVCFEAFLPWMLITTAIDRPQVLVLLCNYWWNQPTAIHKQTLIFQLWGRLMGTPTLIAANF